MTVHLPSDVERSIEAAVRGGYFASVDEAMTEAARLLLGKLPQAGPPQGKANGDPILGLMQNEAELMDEIVADAYRQRRDETWRDVDL